MNLIKTVPTFASVLTKVTEIGKFFEIIVVNERLVPCVVHAESSVTYTPMENNKYINGRKQGRGLKGYSCLLLFAPQNV